MTPELEEYLLTLKKHADTLTPEQKLELIKPMIQMLSVPLMTAFYMLGCQTHIEGTVVNDPTGDTFRLSFRRANDYEVDPTIDKEYIKQVLEFGNFGGQITIDEYYIHTKYEGFAISIRPMGLSLDFWVQTKTAYVPVSIPLPAKKTAYLSKCIRFIFETLLNQLRQEINVKL